jgi:predicted alpha/beta-hydrolase family hydrolase
MTSRPLILFAHGAGASSASAWMTAWSERLRALGDVVPFDYPYARAGRKLPDRQPTLVAAHRDALAAARAARPPGTKIVLAGKSMGSRIGCHVAADHPGEVDALVCFGYPLRGRAGAMRDGVLRTLATPVLFVQGSRDPLCPLDALEGLRPQLVAPNELFVVDGGDHSLEIGARAAAASGRSQADWDAAILDAVARFLRAHAALPPEPA